MTRGSTLYSSLAKPEFQQNNARMFLRTFLDTENVQLLTWPVRSPGLSPIENFWFMLAKRLVRHHTPVTAVDEP
ncbi:hypothetical protein TNCV_5071211 [Trichonephila clavipes]|nr:hypothetical protein TNCV_5071211 [Trichonephila clavipes]